MITTWILFLADLNDFSKCFSNMTSDVDDISINTTDSISLYDLVDFINKTHRSFKEEYDAIEKVSLGDKVETVNFNSFKKYTDTNNKQRRSLCYDIQGDNNWQLYIVECDGIINTFKVPVGNNADFSNANINPELAIKHLDLFDKYEDLINLYYFLRSRTLYCDKDFVPSSKYAPSKRSLSISIDDGKGLFLDDIEKIRIKMTKHTKYAFVISNRIDITIKLGEELDIIKDECYFTSDIVNKKNCFDALQGVLVNKKLLDINKSEEKEESKEMMLR